MTFGKHKMKLDPKILEAELGLKSKKKKKIEHKEELRTLLYAVATEYGRRTPPKYLTPQEACDAGRLMNLKGLWWVEATIKYQKRVRIFFNEKLDQVKQ